MRVVVHRNLIRGGWSIVALKGGQSLGKVQGHLDAVALTDVTFKVLPGTHAKIIRNQRRTVCAYCIGDLDMTSVQPDAGAEVISYNPFRSLDFTGEDGRTVTSATRVAFAADGKAYATNPN